MLVGLASANMMTLRQSLGILLGADVASSFTIQLFAYKFYYFAPLLIAMGFLLSLAPEQKKIALYGKLILAVGLIFFGMHYMGQAVEPLRTVGVFNFLIKASLSNPWYGLLAGTIFTAIVQSSVGTLTILLALPATFHAAGGWQPGIVNYLPLIIGANFGTCVTALLATVNAHLEGVRVAWAHCLFKAVGVCLVFPFVSFIPHLLPATGISMEMQIANAHALFNVFLSAVCLPFLSGFATIVQKAVTAKASDGPSYRAQFLSNEALSIPIVAISQSVKEISRMSDCVMRMVESSYSLIRQHAAGAAAAIMKHDDEVDFLHESIVKYCTNLSKKELSHDESAKAYELIMVTTDLEHIGDIISKNIVMLGEKIYDSPYPLSSEGKEEILEFFAKTIDRLKMTVAAFTLSDLKLASSVYESKGVFNSEYERYFNRHLERLYNRKIESLQTTSIHIDLIEEISRINYFTFRIAAHILRIYKAD
jgi:phosphate:Na+ symporter